MNKGVNISRIPGFTLVELMVTLAIAAVLATLAAPALTRFLAKSQMNASANELSDSLQLARMEAVSRNTCVSVCRRAESGAPKCAGETGAWDAGWLVYLNPGCSPVATSSDPASGQLLRAQQALPAHVHLANSSAEDNGDVVVYTARGVTLDPIGSTLAMKDDRFPDGSVDRNITLNTVGRVLNVAVNPGGGDD
ncbi:MAG TPA: GspH/FimT family pseudopilin [Aquabacterium sp.]|nr:GspH/FimT family pseudopilin [Aquabacterium sp.]